MTDILKVCGLTKNYGNFILDNINFTIKQNQIVGLVGLNGSGKSTIIKSILNLIDKDNGEIYFCEQKINKRNYKYKEEIGYVGEYRDFYSKQKIKDVKRFYRLFFSSWNEKIYKDLVEKFELDDQKCLSELSTGMKLRFNLALILAHKPKVLLLDEATNGLDSVVRKDILRLILDYVKNNKACALMTSHIAKDMDIADSLLFIDRGRIIAKNKIDDIDQYLEKLKGVNHD